MRYVLVGALLAACAGCWTEYTPDQKGGDPSSPAVVDSAAGFYADLADYTEKVGFNRTDQILKAASRAAKSAGITLSSQYSDAFKDLVGEDREMTDSLKADIVARLRKLK